MDLVVFPLMHSKTKKLMLRTKRKYGARWGHPYYYEPSGQLLERLSVQLGMTKTDVRTKIMQEREYLIKQNSAQEQY